jgi:tripartite-type tricarboxylate transporter receptor subunit TctC
LEDELTLLTRRALAVLAVACIAAVPAKAQTIPGNQIKIIVPFPAGGTTDILARFVAQYLGDRLGVTTLVETVRAHPAPSARKRWRSHPPMAAWC